MIPRLTVTPLSKHWELQAGQAIAVDLVEKHRALNGTSGFDSRPESGIVVAAEQAVRSEAEAR